MKRNKVILSLFLIALSSGLFAQRIENPQTGLNTAPYVTIKAVELTDSATIIDFHTRYMPGNWIMIPKDTYIYAVDADARLYVTGTEGIPFAEEFYMPASGETEYRVIFPPVDPSVSHIDYGEDGGNWHIYDIMIRGGKVASLIPAELQGHWFSQGDWQLSLFDTLAFYNMQTWKYETVDTKKGWIILTNDRNKQKIHYKKGKSGKMLFGESPRSLAEFSRTADFVSENADNSPFSEPLFNSGKAILKGLIKGYSPRIGAKTGIVYVRDIIGGEMNMVLLDINNDGTFKVEVPLNYPQAVYVQSEILNAEVYLEPDQELFMLMDPSLAMKMPKYKDNPYLFMGDNDGMNHWMNELTHLRRYFPAELYENSLNISPEDYKAKILVDLQNALAELKVVKSQKGISDKALQYMINEITYIYHMMLLNYDLMVMSSYSQKIEQRVHSVRDIPGIMPPGIDYYSFLNDALVNNPSAISSGGYNEFLSMLRFPNAFRERFSPVSDTQIFQAIIEEGINLTNDEEKLYDIVKLAETDDYIRIRREIANLNPAIADFIHKHHDQVETSADDNEKEYAAIRLAEKLEDAGISLSGEEKELLGMYQSLLESEGIRNYNAVFEAEENRMLLAKFHSDRAEMIEMIRHEHNTSELIKMINELFGVNKGLATDILFARFHSYKIVNDLNPVSDEKMAAIQQEILSPFIRQYLGAENERVRTKLESDKTAGGYTIQEVPRSNSEELFSNIMEKYRGKLVYVDFWATWCGPCRTGMQQIKPLKEELDGVDVAFVYIAGPGSPRGVWENVITDVKGDHYYLTTDEWNQVSALFNIRGIPHYVLVSKEGEVINANVRQMSNENLKSMFIDYLEPQ
jgi:thiol-disulfide isomerase/thioredoxin